jgi:group I intron endonuclease
MNSISGIYKILNITNGKCYIGSAVNIAARWRIHTSRLRHGNHHSVKLQRSWNKHGKSAFEFSIIEECEIESLLDREQYWIDSLGSFGNAGYNMSPTAGNSLGLKHTPEAREKQSVSAKNRPDDTPECKALKSNGQIARRERERAEGLLNKNTYANSTTGVLGVYFNKARNKWQAQIRVNRKSITLGRYEKIEDAISARKDAERKYYPDKPT